MIVVFVVLALLVIGIAIVIVESRRATPATPQPTRRHQIVVSGALYGLMFFALSPSLLLLDTRNLATQRPEEPWRDPGGGCAEGGQAPPWLGVLGVGLYLAMRGGPAVAAMASARRRRTAPTLRPDGRFALRVAASTAAVVGALVSARVVIGGAADDEFTTYGAFTPRGASGWRVAWTLARLDAPQPIEEGAPIDDELSEHSPSHVGLPDGPDATALPGTQAWVGGAPVLFYRDQSSRRILGSYVRNRNLSEIPEARRPHFARWPEVRRVDDRHLALVGAAQDGGLLAVKVSDYDLDVVAATYGDAWLLARPPLRPWLLGLALAVIGAALARWSRRSSAPGRLLAAWFLLEASAVWAYGYVTSFGFAGLSG